MLVPVVLTEEQLVALRRVSWMCSGLAFYGFAYSAVANVSAVNATLLTVAGALAMPLAVGVQSEIGVRLLWLPKPRGIALSLLAFALLAGAALLMAGINSFGHIVESLVARGASLYEARLTAAVIDITAVSGLFGHRLTAAIKRAHNEAVAARAAAEAERTAAEAEAARLAHEAEHGELAVAVRARAEAEELAASLEEQLTALRVELAEAATRATKAEGQLKRATGAPKSNSKRNGSPGEGTGGGGRALKTPERLGALVDQFPALTLDGATQRLGCSESTTRRAVAVVAAERGLVVSGDKPGMAEATELLAQLVTAAHTPNTTAASSAEPSPAERHDGGNGDGVDGSGGGASGLALVRNDG